MEETGPDPTPVGMPDRMAQLEIKRLGCPILRKQTAPVEAFDDDLRRLIDDMFDTMAAAEGVGLAAPQVGVGLQLAILDVSPMQPDAGPHVLINPKIAVSEGEVVGEEGCLSMPGVVGDVKRADVVRLNALDRDGSAIELTFVDIEARAAQHEIDHLNGVLVIDRFSTIRRNLLRNALRKLKREGAAQAPTLTYAADIGAAGRGGR